LRASISLSMTQQDGLFDPTAKGEASVDDSEAFEPTGDNGADDRGPVTGDPATDRGLAEDNGEDNPRFFSGRSLNLPSGPDLRPPAAFASVGLSLGISGSLALGVDVGFSAGVSAGIGIGIGIEAGIDVGLSAGFDVDIGLGIAFEAQVSGSMVMSARQGGATGAAASGDASPALAADGVARGVSGASVPGAGGTGAPGASDAAGVGGAASEGFASGEFRRAEAAGVRSGSEGALRASAALAHDLEDLPAGPPYGSLAAAGVPAALGAFAGLRPVPPRRRKPLSLAELNGARPERSLRTDVGANFQVGGKASDRVSRGLSADVGARASLSDRVAFDTPLD
jgi:hypothetical protein